MAFSSVWHHPSLFRSFWMAGYESATHINGKGERLDMLAATHHDVLVDEDYKRLREVNMQTARDTVRWHLIEGRPGVYDFSSLDAQLAAARRTAVQVIWDLCHYGWPDGLDIFSPEFVTRFAAFCGATARHIAERLEGMPFYTPINELSFFAWAAGEVGWFHPHGRGRGVELKRQLVRAYIAGTDAIWSVDPRARMVSVEPLIHVVPPKGQPDVGGGAAAYRASQFEAWDMLAGVRDRELGGHPRYLDVMGVNFYHDNQWEHPGGQRLHWHIHPRDPRWMPFHKLLFEAYSRYRRPIVIGETSHVGAGRAEWIREMTDEVLLALDGGVPLEGICLYPIIDRFEWENPSHWHNSGLWDVERDAAGTLQRVLNLEYARELHRSQARLAAHGCGTAPHWTADALAPAV
jgi:hypothetical protein